MTIGARRKLARLGWLLPLLLAHPFASAADNSHDLAQAKALLAAGKPGQAYALLIPQEPALAGTVAYDYLLGTAALDSGHPGEATFALERVLAIDPNYAGARLDLARAWFALGSDVAARTEFNTVLSENPPPAARQVVLKYLAALDARAKARKPSLTGYVDTGIGHDDNITSVTNDFTNAAQQTYQIPAQPTGNSVKRQDNYLSAGGGLDYRYPFDQDKGLHASLDFHRKMYSQAGDFDQSTGSGQLGGYLSQGRESLKGGYHFATVHEKGEIPAFSTNDPNPRMDARVQGLDAEWMHALDKTTQAGLYGAYNFVRYPSLTPYDVNQGTVGFSAAHQYQSTRHPIVVGAIYWTHESAQHPTLSMNPSKNITGLRLASQMALAKDADGFASMGYQWRNDAVIGGRVAGITGRDHLFDLTTGVVWRIRKNWSVRPQVSFYDNRSNLPLYEYHRTDVMVAVRRDFR